MIYSVTHRCLAFEQKRVGSRTFLPGALETVTSCSELPFKMWAPITFLCLSSLSLSLSENRLSSLKESRARVLQIQRVQSQEQCSQVCQDPATAGLRFCSLSTEEPGHCIVLDCPLITVCRDARPRDIQELVTEYALEKRNSVTTTETLLTRADPGPSPALPSHKTIRKTGELIPAVPPVTVTAGNHTELGTETLNDTDVSISAAQNDSSSLGPASTAATGRPLALTTPQGQRATEKTSVAMRTTASAPSTRVGSASLPVTRDQTDGRADSPPTPTGIAVTRPKAASGSATSATVQTLPTHSGISPTSSSRTPPKGGSLEGPSNPEIPMTTSSPILLSSRARAESFTSTPIVSTSTSVESPAKPEPVPFAAQATDRNVTPTATPATVAQAAETSGTSQNTERALPQTTLSPMSPEVPVESSPTMPETSAPTVPEIQYVWIATAPFAQHLVNKNLLLAMLLAGSVLFVAILVLLAVQAYESYKKKDYTQVDYLINGMYADSEM
ncbi:uncharacterized protein C11orf24 homolog isoform X2 [Phascolarctos cinereus]|uniref:Uncharacterized protein C11orf24 homolog isoform X3 n=1 Tax=Phascolarctos cinereus TaxID=38626 RepID=A0A6P5IS06_PHACI|nr:uncharacterized protein C11orf24 homolog isoform X3 [Phascolarctos cinereus]